MKQTNNAIKFLMAQYRAVYKHAYIKGVLSALVVTSGLGLGVANATAQDELGVQELGNPTYGTVKSLQDGKSGDTITIDGKTNTLGITSGGATDSNPDGTSKDKAMQVYKNLSFTGGTSTFTNSSGSGDLYTRLNGKLSTSGEKTSLTFGTTSGTSQASLKGNESGTVLWFYADEINLGKGTTTTIYASKKDASSNKTKSTTVKADKLTINGTVNLYNQLGSNALLFADNVDNPQTSAILNVGDGANITLAVNPQYPTSLSNNSASNTGYSILGWRTELNTDGTIRKIGNAITFSNGSKINLQAHTKTATLLPAYYDQSYSARIWGHTVNFNQGSELTTSGEGGMIEAYETKFNQAKINVGANSVLHFIPRLGQVFHTVDGKDALDSAGSMHKYINGRVEFNGATITNNGNIMLTEGGTLAIDDKTTIKGGQITLGVLFGKSSKVAMQSAEGYAPSKQSLIGTTNSTLEISQAQLAKYLGTGSVGTLYLQQGSRIDFQDTTTVDLDKFNFATPQDAKDGAVTLTSGAINVGTPASGDTIGSGESAEDKLSGDIRVIANSLALSKNAENLTLEAKDKLTLGSNTKDMSAGIKFDKAYAKNLAFASNTDSFKLSQNITLSSVAPRDATLNGEIIAQNGLIEGNVTISGDSADAAKLIIEGGNYSATGKITLSSGSITVNQKSANDQQNLNKFIDSTLEINNLIVDSTKANNVTVSGSKTSLTIHDLDVTGTGTSGSSFTASNGGVINLQDSDVQTILDVASGTDKTSAQGAKKIEFKADSGGIINIDGAITLDYNKAQPNDLDNIFQIKKGGILQADSLTAKVTSGASSVTLASTSGTYRADEMTIEGFNSSTNNSAVDTLTVTDSNFEIGSKLSSNANTLDLQTASVTFGKISSYTDAQNNEIYYIGKDRGYIYVNNLKLSKGKASIESGVWSAENIEVNGAGTEFTLGSASEKYTAKDELIKATLQGKKLTINNGSFKVTDVGIANINELHANNDNGLDISGSMNVSGTEITSDNTDGQDVAVKLAQNSITVQNGGKLVFNTLAVNNSIFDKKEGDEVFLKQGIAQDAIKLEANGQVKLDFDKSVSFTQAQLTSLKSKLFSNDTNGKINGILHIGSAGIEGISEHIKDDGKGNPTIAWDKLQGVADIDQNDDVTNDKLINAKVTGVNSDFKSHVGSLETTSTHVTITGNSSLNNAKGNNGFYAATASGQVASVTVGNGSTLTLKNGGEIGEVTLSSSNTSHNSALVTDGQGTTAIASVKGESGNFFAQAQNTVVSGVVDVNSLSVKQGSALSVSGGITAKSNSSLDGSLTVADTARFDQDLEIKGQANFAKDLHIGQDAFIEGNTQALGTVTLGKNTEIANNASLKANVIKLNAKNQADRVIEVGRVAGSEGELTWEDSSGFLQAERLDLNGGTIIADPSYGNKASIVALNELGSTKAEKNTAGSLDGRLIAAQNSIIALGVGGENVEQHLNEAFLNKFIDSKGSLNGEELGAVAYVAKGLTVQNGSQIIVDSQLTTSSYKKDGLNPKQAGHDVYLAENSALVIDEKALSKDKAAVYFNKDGATIYGDGGKVLLSGAIFTPGKTHNIFAAKTGDVKAVTDGTKVLRFESISGLFYQDFANGETLANINLTLNEDNLANAYYNATDSVKESLLIYSVGDHDWLNQDPDYSEPLTNGLAKGLTYDKTTGQITDKDGKVYHENNYVLIFDKEGNATVYNQANNSFLNHIRMDNLDGSIADKAANIGIYGGVAQSALAVGSATNDAISSRMGVGGQSNLTFANNGQGAGLWVSPLYKNYESDGFKAQNLKYGVDMDMYGLALGGDYTMTNGLRMGLMFNVGSGDAEGQQAAQGVKNDFDFFGFGLYGGYEMNNFSIMADVSYSVADNDVKTSSSIDKISASLDSKALSLGVTGQYKLALNGLNVVPHAGLRFTRIDMDDYSIKGEKYGHIADVDSEDLNIFSIPVGVSISKDIVAGTWTVKPSFDLTLTGNFGDDVAKSKVDWTGVDNLITDVKGEVIDSFTYGASLGIAAQSGNFSFGLGTNYTGSSNTDEFGVNANARFVF